MKAPRLLKSSLLMATVLLLSAGCQTLPESTNDQSNSEAATTKTDTTAAAQRGYYSPVIKDDRYALNDARGLSVGNTSQANRENTERSTYRMLTESFPPDDYQLKEGAVISKDQLSKWLGAKTKDNSEGLNPEKSDSGKANDFEPHYLNTIFEYDLMGNKQENSDKLQAISLTLVLNSEDQATSDSKMVTIDQKTAIKQGKSIAQEILNRLRQQKDYQEIPIQFYLFYNAPSDNLAGGSIVSSTQVSPDSSSFGDWEDNNAQHIAFGVDKAPNQEDTTKFDRYRQSVVTLFPELSGISGVGLYQDSKLSQLTLTIHTPFDGYSETVALMEQAIAQANSTFDKNLNINIKIQGPSGNTASAQRTSGNDFSMTIF
ncbi:MAG: CamS family sex pheromone protein [Aerococcus sp.]|nr:CamS family sex pheromone protein [Aerococcus sp.]